MPSDAAPRRRSRANAEQMATKQREISVSEFFAKNRHLLGFDNPRKALLTTVKEAVDNALDACEEAGILPDIEVRIEEITPPPSASKPGRYRVTVTDNGPGIVRRQVENIFGRLLYGSKFHRLKMSRGQQGIGISAAGMYGLMTTGKPMVITTKPHKSKPAHHLELAMDTSKNKPEVTVDVETDDFPETSSGTGTRVSIEMEARFQRGKVSVEAYLEQTGIANPHAQITFVPPDKANQDPELTPADDASAELAQTAEFADKFVYPRTVEELPPETEEIKPHPYGVELGNFLRMLKTTDEKQLAGFFKQEFCRVPPSVVKEVASRASSKDKTITGQTYVSTVDHAEAERIYTALQESKLRSPPTDCLSPIGVRQMLAGMLKGVRAEFYAASTRAPAVYRGNPFQIEAAIAFGGDLPAGVDGKPEPARVIRFANRVPLLYQQSACCSFKSVVDTSWRNYGLAQPRGSAPMGPLVVMIHMTSVWVPFTSESKEAIADYDEIRKEMKLALQECGRKPGIYLRRRPKMKRESQKRDVFERYIGEIAKSTAALTGLDASELYDALKKQAERRTEIADRELDEDGNYVKKPTRRDPLEGDDGVLIVGPDGTDDSGSGASVPAEDTDASKGEPPRRHERAEAKGEVKAGSKPTKKKRTGSKPASKNPVKDSIKNKGKPKPRRTLGVGPAGGSAGGLFEGGA